MEPILEVADSWVTEINRWIERAVETDKLESRQTFIQLRDFITEIKSQFITVLLKEKKFRKALEKIRDDKEFSHDVKGNKVREVWYAKFARDILSSETGGRKEMTSNEGQTWKAYCNACGSPYAQLHYLGCLSIKNTWTEEIRDKEIERLKKERDAYREVAIDKCFLGVAEPFRLGNDRLKDLREKVFSKEIDDEARRLMEGKK